MAVRPPAGAPFKGITSLEVWPSSSRPTLRLPLRPPLRPPGTPRAPSLSLPARGPAGALRCRACAAAWRASTRQVDRSMWWGGGMSRHHLAIGMIRQLGKTIGISRTIKVGGKLTERSNWATGRTTEMMRLVEQSKLSDQPNDQICAVSHLVKIGRFGMVELSRLNSRPNNQDWDRLNRADMLGTPLF